jgi:hypothetical protein
MMAAPIGVQRGRLYLDGNPAIPRTVRGRPMVATFRRSRLGAGASCHGIPVRGSSWDSGNSGDAGGVDTNPATAARLAKPTVDDVTRQAAWEASKEKGLRGVASGRGGIRSGTHPFPSQDRRSTSAMAGPNSGANPYASDFAQARRDPKTLL